MFLPSIPPRVAAFFLGLLVAIAVLWPVEPSTFSAASTSEVSTSEVSTSEVTAIRYSPPVGGPVIRPFEPHREYGPGHRGVDHQVAEGQAVRSAAEGVVTFAGQVAGQLHVTIEHADRVKTTYSYLREVLVSVGTSVRRSQPIARSGERMHVGARVGGRYFDPLSLYGTRRAVLAA